MHTQQISSKKSNPGKKHLTRGFSPEKTTIKQSGKYTKTTSIVHDG
jgi:hypothetical protein